MANTETMLVEVMYALPDAQFRVEVTLPVGSTVRTALEHSGLPRRFPGIDVQNCKLGVFGRSVKLDYVLDDGQRVEIYRPLLRDPKEARRQRAALNRRDKAAR